MICFSLWHAIGWQPCQGITRFLPKVPWDWNQLIQDSNEEKRCRKWMDGKLQHIQGQNVPGEHTSCKQYIHIEIL